MAKSVTAYRQLDSGLYNLNNAEILARFPNEQEWFQFGDCDAASLNLEVERIERTAKRGRVRTTALSLVQSIDSEVSITAMQFRPQLRAGTLLGDIVYHTQTAESAGTFTITGVKKGGIYNVGKYDISEVSVSSTGGSPIPLVEGTHFIVVDAADGSIQIIDLPSGVVEDDELDVLFDAAAITAADKRARIGVSERPAITVELKIRGTGENGFDATLHLFQVQLAPDGGIDFLSDELAQATLSGAAELTANGVGYWQEHSSETV